MKTPLQLHAEKWRSCTACDYAKTRRRVVIGRGSVPCTVLFVGQAPGKSEDATGWPFVGNAGELLDRIIAASLGVPPRHTYAITNVVGCLPVDAETGEKDVTPDDASCLACLPRLAEFVTLCEPKLIVTVGKVATDWLDPTWKKALKTGVPQVDVTHPSAILRTPPAQQPTLTRKAVITIAGAVKEYIDKPAAAKAV